MKLWVPAQLTSDPALHSWRGTVFFEFLRAGCGSGRVLVQAEGKRFMAKTRSWRYARKKSCANTTNQKYEEK